ncbi:hypothetical protein [Lysobacter capsici]|uniref:hypothetical protein n=1 Tax=Lysobacter capsici TaxID=435897 RepID=UPI001BFFECDE|nr:hypothetical protein [Lysobacter capsici]MBW8808991.1 hypothetical protein [Lysobacter sp.]QWF18589.1 hypothetical protein KME82_07535 [Lysobacter capsici]
MLNRMFKTHASRRTKLSLLIAGLAVSLTASAIPPAGPGQSQTYTYYADATRTVVVGGWSYGSCGEPFDWGDHTRYFTIRTVNCGGNPQP